MTQPCSNTYLLGPDPSKSPASDIPVGTNSMSGNVFVDTNVLVYARDSSEPEKRGRAHEWMMQLWAARPRYDREP